MSRRTTIVSLALLLASCGDDPAADSGGSSTSADTSTGAPTTTSTNASTTTTASTGSSTDEGSSSAADTSTTSESSSGSVDGSSSDTGVGDCRPVLAEVLYDAQGGDDELQWVKLHNPCSAAIDLSGWSIGYGGPDYVPDIDPPFGVKTLQGSLAAGGCWIVGGPMHDAAQNGDPVLDFAEDFAPSLELPIDVGAGVALFDVPADMVDTSTVPSDAVVYGPNNDNGLIDATGSVAQPHVAGSIAGGSIQRTALDATWSAADVPTPGACPSF